MTRLIDFVQSKKTRKRVSPESYAEFSLQKHFWLHSATIKNN